MELYLYYVHELGWFFDRDGMSILILQYYIFFIIKQ